MSYCCITDFNHPINRRNPGKTLPVAFVIVVSVSLVAAVVTLIDSIDLTILTMYGYNRHFTVITPRNALAVSEKIEKYVKGRPLTTEVYTARPAFTFVKTIFGKMPFVVFGMSPQARESAVRRCGLRLAYGRFPEEGKPEVTLSKEIARNKHLRLGDVVLKPELEDSYSAVPMRLVGTLEGPVWLALSSEQFIHDHFPLAPRGLLVMGSDQGKLDGILEKNVDKQRARVWTYGGLVRETKDALSSLYLIMNVVIGIIVFAIAFLTGMLANIYFTQRLPEFATLSAIGYQKGKLVARALSETALLCLIGWLLGSLLTVGVLSAIKTLLIDPRGLLLDPFDLGAYKYTLPLPVAICTFVWLAIGRRLYALDPVSIIERRV